MPLQTFTTGINAIKFTTFREFRERKKKKKHLASEGEKNYKF